MIDETKLRAHLIDRIAELTHRGRLEWQRTARSNEFQVSFTNQSIRIVAPREKQSVLAAGLDIFTPDSSRYILKIFNSDGYLIDEIDNHSVDSLGRDYYRILETTYREARRQALNVEENIQELLYELDADSADESGR